MTLVQLWEYDMKQSQARSCQHQCTYKIWINPFKSSQDSERKLNFGVNQGP